MKDLDEYRDGAAAEKLAAAVTRTLTRPKTIMAWARPRLTTGFAGGSGRIRLDRRWTPS